MAAELGALSGTRAQKRPSARAGPASLGSPAPIDPGPMSVSGSPKRFLVGHPGMINVFKEFNNMQEMCPSDAARL